MFKVESLSNMKSTFLLSILLFAWAHMVSGCPYLARSKPGSELPGSGDPSLTHGSRRELLSLNGGNGGRKLQGLTLSFPAPASPDEGIGPNFPCPLAPVEKGRGPLPAQRVSQVMRDCFIKELTAEIALINQDRLATGSNNTITADLLRLAFHDCGAGTCDGSVLLNLQELLHPNNHLIEGTEEVLRMKNRVKMNCQPNWISWADAIILGTVIGIYTDGGPDMRYDIPLGRCDGARYEKPQMLPAPTMNVLELVNNFRGIFKKRANAVTSLILMVTLSGAHTVGEASCRTFAQRIADGLPQIDPDLQNELHATCTISCIKVGFDDTMNTFDNQYYIDLLDSRGLLYSDQVLFTPGGCVGGVCADDIVQAYARDQDLFFKNFKWAFCQMATLGTKLKCHPKLYAFYPLPKY